MKKSNLKGSKYLRYLGALLLGFAVTAFSSNSAKAQISCYSFSQFMDTYTPISGGTQFCSASSVLYTSSRPIGFDFNYNNLTNQNTIWFTLYGYMHFGSSATATYWIMGSSGTNYDNSLLPFHGYLYLNTTNYASTCGAKDVTLGVAPNRVYICEYRDMYHGYTGVDERINFQVHLYEGSDAIEFRYGNNSTLFPYDYYQIGLRGVGTNDFHARAVNGNWLTSTKGTTAGSTYSFSNTSYPPNGLVYRFERYKTLNANFIAPGQAYVDALVKYTTSNPGFNIEWDKLDDNTIESTANTYTTTYSTAGTYTMEMVAYNCLVADTVKKDIVIIDPTSAPVADFVSFDNDILIYENIDLFDLSTQGPNIWDWWIGDTSNIPLTEQTKTGNNPYNDANPVFNTWEPGLYSVCLRTGNALGYSSQVCKYDYIKVNPVTLIAMGPIKSSNSTTGTITDNGGDNFNYSDGRYDDFVIAACNADSIILTFNHFKLADNGDRLLIYDGADANGIPFHSTNQGFDKDNPPPKELIATSGAMKFIFITNGSGTDSGFSATWKTILGSATPPVTVFTHPDTIYTGVPTTLKNATFARGEVFHYWNVQGDPNTYLTEDLENYTFVTSGLRNVCLKDSTCVGKNQYCKNVFVFTQTTPVRLDFEATPRRVKAGIDVVTLEAFTEQANMFEWSIFPGTYTPQGPVNERTFKVRFDDPGPYTITLKAWNSVGGQANTQKIVLKDDYVIAVEYCQPAVQILSSDVGVSKVTLRNTANPPVTLIDNESEVGAAGYTDYTEDVPKADLYFGVSYDVTLRRPTPAVNPVNRKVWIDYNIDGEFDATETVLSEGKGNAVQRTEQFTVPTLDNSFAGPTRMRASAVYSNLVNTGCGTGNGTNPLVGEYEDYRVDLVVDPDQPVITLIGSDTVLVEVNKTYTELSATVFDPSQGDITGNLVISGEVDTDQTGIYRLTYSAKDASGNAAFPVTRVVMVVVDNTAPEITDLGNGDSTIEVYSDYVVEKIKAIDSKDGDLSTAISIENNLDNTKLGTYDIIYTVSDNQGNTATFVRKITVVDTQKPEILALGSDNVQVGTAFVDMTTVKDNYDQNPTFVVTGEIVNPNVIGEYQVTYTSVDASGNVADVLIRTYKVDDFIAPQFRLGSSESIIHDVRTPFIDYTTIEGLEENYYPLSQVKITKDLSQIDVNTIGTYTMTVTASDPSGNSTTITRDIIVVDRKAPLLFGAYDLEVKLYDSTFWVFEGIKVEDNYYPPSVLLPRIQVIDHNINVYKEGLYYATFRVVDPSNNASAPIDRMIRVCANCETTTSTKDLGLRLDVNVYPNPSNGVVNIDYTLSSVEDVKVEVTNMLGSKLQEVSASNTQDGTLSVDLSDQPAGVYFVRITSGNVVITKKVTIQ